MASSQARERLIQTAVDVFYRCGYHATGIEKILAQAGVSKPTLYKHFRSKEELILAALRRWDEDSRNWLMRAMEQGASQPKERLLVLFDILEQWFSEPGFQGCMFINATAEYADQDNAIHAVAAEHKRLFLSYLKDLAQQAGALDPGELAHAIALVMEGAIVTAHVSGDGAAALRAKKIAEPLVQQAIPDT